MGFRKLGEAYSLGKLGKTALKGFRWEQFATFEAGLVTPYPTGLDAIGGAGVASIAVTQAAAMRGNFGLSVGIPDVNPRFGDLTVPDNENQVIFETLFDPNGLTLAGGDLFRIAEGISSGPGGFAWIADLRGPVGVFDYRIRLGIADDVGAFTLVTQGIMDVAIKIRIAWRASKNPGDNDGFLRASVDDSPVLIANAIDNDQQDVDTIRIGAISGIDAGTNGTIYFDNIRWANKFI